MAMLVMRPQPNTQPPDDPKPQSHDYQLLCAQLRQQLQDKDKDLLLAAEIGQNLLKANEGLSQALSAQRSCEHCANLTNSAAAKSVNRKLRRRSSSQRVEEAAVLEHLSDNPAHSAPDAVTSSPVLPRRGSPVTHYVAASPRRMKSDDFRWPGSPGLSCRSSGGNGGSGGGNNSDAAPIPPPPRMLKHRSVSCASDLANADYYIVTLEAEYAEACAQVAKLQSRLREETHALARRAETSEGAVADLRTELAAVTDELEQLRVEKRTLVRQIKSERREQTWFETEDRDRVAKLLEKLREAEEEAARESSARAALEDNLKRCLYELDELRGQSADLAGAAKENLALNQLCERQTSHIKELQEQLESLRASYTAVTAELDAKATPLPIGCPILSPSPESIPTSSSSPSFSPPPTNPFKELASARFGAASLLEPAAPVFGQIYDRVAGPMYLSPLDIRRSLRSEMRQSRRASGASASGKGDEGDDNDREEEEGEGEGDDVYVTPLGTPLRSRAVSEDGEHGKYQDTDDVSLPPAAEAPADQALNRRPRQPRHHGVRPASVGSASPLSSRTSSPTTPSPSPARRFFSPTFANPHDLFMTPSSPALSHVARDKRQFNFQYLEPHHPQNHYLHINNNNDNDTTQHSNDDRTVTRGGPAWGSPPSRRRTSMASSIGSTDEEEGMLNGGTALLSLLWKLKEWVVPGS
ncbi:hypothetical protein HDU87_007782 [Geranomyces variabilis]|uniref:Uncharacterized protein n=1 Tax=Geranomyces variabilis TaxID=109894 RepID=A0AAD5TDP6_9FUNG|nr:hypothetical protein HDU87_007782 [Geranomyces variabilis]